MPGRLPVHAPDSAGARCIEHGWHQPMESAMQTTIETFARERFSSFFAQMAAKAA
jgi:hypothetical protein